MPSNRYSSWCQIPSSSSGQKLSRCCLQEQNSLFQRVLAVTLTVLLAFTAFNIAFRVLLVMWALVGAAVRYSVVAILLVITFVLIF